MKRIIESKTTLARPNWWHGLVGTTAQDHSGESDLISDSSFHLKSCWWEEFTLYVGRGRGQCGGVYNEEDVDGRC